METPEPQQEIRNALQSYDMEPDVQAVFMFTRGHLMLTVDYVVKEKEQRAASLDRRLLDLPGGGRWLGWRARSSPAVAASRGSTWKKSRQSPASKALAGC